MSDKLLTLKETSECLRLSEDQVRTLVREGKLPAYHIGGVYLRFKEENVFDARIRYAGTQSKEPSKKYYSDSKESTFLASVKDFLYFNDFYIFSAILIVFLLFIILKSIR